LLGVPACSAILLAVPANLLIPPAMQNMGVHTDEGMQQGSSHVFFIYLNANSFPKQMQIVA
jgi:hypothetical protein